MNADLLGPGSGDEAKRTTARQITTAAELDALWERENVLIEATGTYANGTGEFARCWARPVPAFAGGEPGAWEVLVFGESIPSSLTTSALIRSATVLYDPSAEPAPEPDDRGALARLTYGQEAQPMTNEATETIIGPRPWEWLTDESREHYFLRADALIAAGFRRHPEPVKPSRAVALHAAGRRWWDLNTGATDPWDSLTDDERANVIENEGIGPLVDAVLAVSPGRTEAEVLREAAQDAHHLGAVAGSGVKVGALASAWLSGRADRAEREQIGGGDRG